MEIYLIRHGQSVNNALGDDLTRRVMDAPLTELGQQQAAHVAQHLAAADYPEAAFYHNGRPRDHYGLTHLYCSAMQRALQTALPIGQALGLMPEVWVDIHEHGGIYLDDEHGAPSVIPV
jgi:2,3-bisphosphoglycerate-dependent phosphoglycerate mutase/probable phosphoglycerate mutase